MNKNLTIRYLEKFRQCKYLTEICDELIYLFNNNKDMNPIKGINNDKNNNNSNPLGNIEWSYDILGNLVPSIKNGQEYIQKDVRDQLMNTGEYNFKVNFGGNAQENMIYENYQFYQKNNGISPSPLTEKDIRDLNSFH